MAERAGGWIERVERRGWEQFFRTPVAGTYFRSLGPFPAGFSLVDMRVSGHRTSPIKIDMGFVVSGSSEASEVNYRAGVPVIHSADAFIGQPGMTSERIQYNSSVLDLRPHVGSNTGSWYVIWCISYVSAVHAYWMLGVVVERCWHEWRWAPVAGGELGALGVDLE